MANFVAVFNRQASSASEQGDKRTFKSGKILGVNTSAPVFNYDLETARIARVEAASVAEAQEIVKEAWPSLSTGTVVVVTEAGFKES